MRFFKDSRLDIYLGEIQADLSRVETLIGNAADLLFASFSNVNVLVRVQQKLAAELASARESGVSVGAGPTHPYVEDENDQTAVDQYLPFPLALAQQAVVADQIDQEINNIVRALQFQDLTTQLLAHARSRLAALESTLERISDGFAMTAPWRDDEAVAAGQGKARLQPPAGRAQAQIIHFPLSKPVVQQHGMETGDIELF